MVLVYYRLKKRTNLWHAEVTASLYRKHSARLVLKSTKNLDQLPVKPLTVGLKMGNQTYWSHNMLTNLYIQPKEPPMIKLSLYPSWFRAARQNLYKLESIYGSWLTAKLCCTEKIIGWSRLPKNWTIKQWSINQVLAL